MRPTEPFAWTSLMSCFSIFLLAKLPMMFGPPWKDSLESKMRWKVTCSKWSCSLWIHGALTIYNISSQDTRICCCNSRVARLINLRRKNEWFYPSSPRLDRNTLYLSPRFIQWGSPLARTRPCSLLMLLLNLCLRNKTSSSTWEKSRAPRHILLLCTMAVITQNRDT